VAARRRDRALFRWPAARSAGDEELLHDGVLKSSSRMTFPPVSRRIANMGVSTRSTFARFASATARLAGRPITFAMAVALVLGWAITGPIFDFSNTWQLVINTFTTILTFLMVFLIQNTQNRDAEAMHIKLDELIRAVKGAQNTLLDLEDLDEKELDRIRGQYEKLAREARRQLDARTSSPKNNHRGKR